jgi:hypothetical protein
MAAWTWALCAVAAPKPQATGLWFTVYPDVAELMAVTALRKTILSSICLHPDCDVAEACYLPRHGRTSGSYGTA